MPSTVGARTGLLRDRRAGRAVPVTNMELFFDLVYVFAFTQLSELLYLRLSWLGAAETAVIFVALWYAWTYTAWATGWLDPERLPVVALLAVLMVASLVMAASILDSFAQRGEAFAIAYVVMQLLRGGVMAWAFGPRDPMGRNYLRLLGSSALSGVVWIVGGVLHGLHTRLLVWACAAAAVDLLAPALGFRLPGAGSRRMSDWSVAGGHLAERCRLLLMIAFGESVLRIGEAWTHRDGSFGADCAFVVGFGWILCLWSIYFLHHAEPGARTIEQAGEDAAHLARSAFMYAHAAMIAGVLVVAVAIHMGVEAPSEAADAGFAAISVGGPALFLLGLAMSKRWLRHGRHQWPLLGVVALAAAGFAAARGSRLVELVVVTAVSAALAVWAQLAD
ncbi:MAG TPA: low temperature requirement protein A [Solirubrobacteraceae bacterium]|nr:low temperature requirement protein A [Solirubrobacteraceae bacterium]